MKSIVAIDPGTTESAYVVWNGSVQDSGFVPNPTLRSFITARIEFLQADAFAIEMIASYGMPVGRETFETVLWIGRFFESVVRTRNMQPSLVYRKDVKLSLCGTARAKDPNVRQALIDKYGPCGTKKAPGKLYGISGHLWAALAVADYASSHLIAP